MKDIFNWNKDFSNFGYNFSFVYILFFFSFLSSVAEILSLSFFIPIFEIFLNSDNMINVDSNKLSYYFHLFINFINLDYNLFNLLLVSFILFLISRLFIYSSSYLNFYFETKITKEIRDLMQNNYFQASSEYFDNVNSSDFINIAQVQIKQAIAKVFLKIKFAVFLVSAIVSLFALVALSYKLTLLTIFITLIPVILSSIWIKKSRYVGKEHSLSEKDITNYLMGRLKALKLIFFSNSYNLEKKNYFSLTNRTRKLLLLNQILKLKTQVFMEVSSIFIALSLAYLAIIYLQINVEIIFLYLIISIRLIPIIKNILSTYQSIRANIGSMEIVQDFFAAFNLEKNKSNVLPQSNLDQFNKIKNIKFSKVNYSYKPNKKEILQNINFEIQSNSLNLIVGPSGAGKSTILDLISTYRKPTNGDILVNNLLFEYKYQNQIKSQISYLPQDTVFFESNIFDHITYNKSFDKNLLNTALNLSGVSEFINLDTDLKSVKLTENASNFSGGQKQRIDLARIIYENRSILILDEPTNQLDYEKENKFIKNIKTIVKQRGLIAIMITHKIELGHLADNIILIENGQIIAQGQHKELLRNINWYNKKMK